MINRLKEDLKKYDTILVLNDTKIYDIVYKYQDIAKKKNVLIYVQNSENYPISNGIFQKITLKEYYVLLKLYNTYEFTDKITIISESAQYPSLLNYLKTGIITEDEFVKTLLH